MSETDSENDCVSVKGDEDMVLDENENNEEEEVGGEEKEEKKVEKRGRKKLNYDGCLENPDGKMQCIACVGIRGPVDRKNMNQHMRVRHLAPSFNCEDCDKVEKPYSFKLKSLIHSCKKPYSSYFIAKGGIFSLKLGDFWLNE